MPKLNTGRSVGVEANVARRIALMRDERGQSYEVLAKLMTDAGCAIAGSSIYKIEKGDPPRGVSVDELVTLSKIWGVTIDDLLTPVELIAQERAREIAAALPGLFVTYEASVMSALQLYKEYGDIAADDPELLEYLNSHAGAFWNRHPETPSVDLGDNVTQGDVDDLRRHVSQLWSEVLGLAAKAAKNEGKASHDGQHPEA